MDNDTDLTVLVLAGLILVTEFVIVVLKVRVVLSRHVSSLRK